jgi:hypothetical protein
LEKRIDQDQEQTQSKDGQFDGLSCDQPNVGVLVNYGPPLSPPKDEADHK